MQVELRLRGRVHGAPFAHPLPPSPLLRQIPDGAVKLPHVDHARVVGPLANLVDGLAVRLLGKLLLDQDMLSPGKEVTSQTEQPCLDVSYFRWHLFSTISDERLPILLNVRRILEGFASVNLIDASCTIW